MRRVIGVGGIFFQAKDPTALRAWYKTHLGVDVQDWGGAVFTGPADPEQNSVIWTISEEGASFAPGTSRFMINYRVADLKGLLAALKAEGCQVLDQSDDSEYGKFGWVIDPEGNKVELWEAPPKA